MTIRVSDVNRWYERRIYLPRVAAYYDQSDFFNFGYWLEDTLTQKDACENLVERLLSFIPRKQGTILDVACGRGATTRYLLRYYRPSDVTGIDISRKQLSKSVLNVPGGSFVLTSAPELGFGDGVFDSAICVEAAFHFDTRQRFLHEACRVLKPGGSLVLSDILLARWAERGRRIRTIKNYVPSLQAYRGIYLRAGFQDVQVVDATQECWTSFCRHWLRWQWQVTLLSRRDVRTFVPFLLRLGVAMLAMRYYLLVSARKV
jgi:ubiquinone/menaquinone biosynthesis C-methylase UbiE